MAAAPAAADFIKSLLEIVAITTSSRNPVFSVFFILKDNNSIVTGK
jgi:hypothetical protein